MLPQTGLGSYNASHLWGGLWASIDGGKEGSGGETLGGQREKEEGAGEVGRDQGGSTLAHEFHPFSPKIKCPNKCCGYKGSEPGKSTTFDWLPGTAYQINILTPTPPQHTSPPPYILYSVSLIFNSPPAHTHVNTTPSSHPEV